METPVTLISAFLLGLFSTVHCVGMCGGIIAALSLSLPIHVREYRSLLLVYVTTYNVGRIVSYTLAGFIAGAIGAEVVASSGLGHGHTIVRMVGLAMMVAMGCYLTGWFPQLGLVEKIGLPIWKKLEPTGRKLLPVNSLAKALLYGMIWGWLPCALVYFVVLWALTSGGAIQGALTMLAFGLGTLPTLMASGFMASWLTGFARSDKTRRVVGLLIVAMAVASLFLPMDHSAQH